MRCVRTVLDCSDENIPFYVKVDYLHHGNTMKIQHDQDMAPSRAVWISNFKSLYFCWPINTAFFRLVKKLMALKIYKWELKCITLAHYLRHWPCNIWNPPINWTMPLMQMHIFILINFLGSQIHVMFIDFMIDWYICIGEVIDNWDYLMIILT